MQRVDPILRLATPVDATALGGLLHANVDPGRAGQLLYYYKEL